MHANWQNSNDVLFNDYYYTTLGLFSIVQSITKLTSVRPWSMKLWIVIERWPDVFIRSHRVREPA